MKKISLSLIALLFILVSCNSAKPQNNTAFADAYTTLLKSGDESKHESFGDLQKQINAILEESKATYVYLIMPIKAGKAAVDGDLSGDFMLTIDGSNPPEDWGVTYHNEVQFTEAWNLQVAAARSAWADGENAWCWSAFAPIINSQGQVVALLGVDYPATDVITKYPQWSRHDANWNGFNDVISGDIPSAISAKMDEVKAIVEKYAKQLSAK